MQAQSERLFLSRSISLLLLATILGALVCNRPAVAQVPLANPNLNLYSDGTINAMANDPVDGSVIVGGNFTTLNGLPRNSIAKIDANGSVDPTWNPGNFSQVYTIAVDSSGNVYAGGTFYAYAGNNQYIQYLAKISGAGNGVVDASWNPAPDNDVTGLAVDSSGNVFAAGPFHNIGGQARSYIAKLSGTGTGSADPTWNPAPNGFASVWALSVDSNGAVYAGGNFTNIGGLPRNHLAKLSNTGTGAADAIWNPNPDGNVYLLAIDTTNNIYVGGNFANIGGQVRSGFARLSNTGAGTADASWAPNFDNLVSSIAFDGAGNSYLGGSFSSVNGSARSGIAKLTSTADVDSAWNAGSVVAAPSCPGSGLCAPINAVAITGSGLIVAGGNLDSVAGQTRRGLAEFTAANATLQSAQDAIRTATVNALAAQPGGGVIVGGSFQYVGTTPRSNLLRLQTDGRLDTTWNPGANGVVNKISINAATGAIYVAGGFGTIGGQYEYGLAKIASSGVVDTTWAPAPDCAPTTALTLDSSGNVYVGGCFSSIGGQSRANIAKLDGATGTADPNWNASTDYGPTGLAVDNTNGWVYAFGYFQNAGGSMHKYLARFSTSGAGAVDPNWNPNPDYQMNSIAIDTDGSVFVGGYFQNIGGQVRSNIAKLTGANGSADATWNPTACGPFALTLDGNGALYANGCALAKLSTTGTGIDPVYSTWNPGNIDGNVFATALDANGNVYVGGQFTTIGSTSRTDLAALPPTAPAIPSTERDVLVALYNDTTGANWTNHTNWLGAVGTECGWYGVTCSNGHVTGIVMESNNLTGPLPALAALTELQSFDMRYNHLNGQIPAINSLHSLQTFLVEVNQLTGSIPDLSGMSALSYFGVGSNPLSGQIPSLGSLTNLVSFWVQDDNLTGTIPSLTGLSNLNTFWAQGNQLTGTIPSLTGLGGLYMFWVQGNQLTGGIPSLAGLSNLGNFEVNNNRLSGSIPSLSGFTHLTYFIADDNQLTGNIPILSGLTNLVQFSVSGNQLTGAIPDLSTLSALQFFYVGRNQLSGSLPNPPTTNSLIAGGSNLCPNSFTTFTDNAGWDAATGVTPWWATPFANNACDDLFNNGFE